MSEMGNSNLSLTQRLQTGLGLMLWDSRTIKFSIFDVLALRKCWNVVQPFGNHVTRRVSHAVIQDSSIQSYKGHDPAGFPSYQGVNVYSCLPGRKENPLDCDPRRAGLRNPAVPQMMVSLWQPAHLQLLLYLLEELQTRQHQQKKCRLQSLQYQS